MKLCRELEKEFAGLGCGEYRIMVGSDLSQAKSFYESMGAVKLKQITIHASHPSILYHKKI